MKRRVSSIEKEVQELKGKCLYFEEKYLSLLATVNELKSQKPLDITPSLFGSPQPDDIPSSPFRPLPHCDLIQHVSSPPPLPELHSATPTTYIQPTSFNAMPTANIDYSLLVSSFIQPGETQNILPPPPLPPQLNTIQNISSPPLQGFSSLPSIPTQPTNPNYATPVNAMPTSATLSTIDTNIEYSPSFLVTTRATSCSRGNFAADLNRQWFNEEERKMSNVRGKNGKMSPYLNTTLICPYDIQKLIPSIFHLFAPFQSLLFVHLSYELTVSRCSLCPTQVSTSTSNCV